MPSDCFDQALAAIRAGVAQAASPRDALQATMALIQQFLPHYRWVGVYVLQGDCLALGPYVGAPTEHTCIRTGVGVCGTAVAEGRNQVIEDVTKVCNYLPCSLHVKSEIVVLVRENTEILGVLDADGHEKGAFRPADEAFLMQVAQVVAPQVRALA